MRTAQGFEDGIGDIQQRFVASERIELPKAAQHHPLIVCPADVGVGVVAVAGVALRGGQAVEEEPLRPAPQLRSLDPCPGFLGERQALEGPAPAEVRELPGGGGLEGGGVEGAGEGEPERVSDGVLVGLGGAPPAAAAAGRRVPAVVAQVLVDGVRLAQVQWLLRELVRL